MSPEPKHDAVDENWSAANLNTGTEGASDSESEDEDPTIEGYILLAQEPVEGDLLLADEDEEWVSSTLNIPETLTESTTDQIQLQMQSETVQVWSSCNCSNIDMDADKINQVKDVMASFSLPNTSIPEWANTITEEQWKEQLMVRIKTMQNSEITEFTRVLAGRSPGLRRKRK